MKRDPKSSIGVRMERHKTNEMSYAGQSLRYAMEHSKFVAVLLKSLAVLGVSLIMADGVLTPAQSVLGAIQGLEVVVPDISTGTIIGVSCAILILLFLAQPLGITKLGSAFAPIVIIWLLFNASFGIYNLAKHDHSVLKAFSPWFAGNYFVVNGTSAWESLGGILLCFTGVEALFADLGAFSKRAIQISWLCFVYPCLLLAYIGQAAYLMDDPTAYSNPLFKTVPPGTFWPTLIISILAAIVASQAIITGTFQLLSQIINVSYFPPISMKYTSSTFHGQVYIPVANWLLMIGTVIVTAVYSNTTRLGNAYGVCVILVTFITTCMITLVALIVWRINILIVLAIFLPFITLDGLYMSSAMVKVPTGAWFTILLALLLASIFILWRFGKDQQWAAEAKDHMPHTRLVVRDAQTGEEHLHSQFGGGKLTWIKGLGIFFDKAGHSVPMVYSQFLRKFEARPEVHVFLQMRSLGLPTIAESEKYSVVEVPGIENCYRVTIRHGYNDEIVTKELAGTVYAQVRRYIMQTSRRYTSPPVDRSVAIEYADGTTSTVAGPADAGRLSLARDRMSKDSTTATTTAIELGAVSKPDMGSSSVAERQDETSARKLAALDRAFDTQTVYIVGKEQLRLLGRDGHSFSELVGPRAWRRLFLAIFIWIRENTRAKVASMRIPVDKLVEVGFVKEI